MSKRYADVMESSRVKHLRRAAATSAGAFRETVSGTDARRAFAIGSAITPAG
jgi:hypothetical protein